MHRTLTQATRTVKKAKRSWRSKPEGSQAKAAAALRLNMAAIARLRQTLLAKGVTHGKSVRKLESAHRKMNRDLSRLREIETLLEKTPGNEARNLVAEHLALRKRLEKLEPRAREAGRVYQSTKTGRERKRDKDVAVY